MELDREVSKAISLIVKSADEVEKNLSAYKKKAVAQKAKIEKALLKASPRKTARAPRKGVAAAAQKGAVKRAPKKAIGRASARRA